MNKLKAAVLLLILSFVSSINIFAGAEEIVSDKEVKDFASIVKHLKEINMHAQNQVLNIVMAEGMSPERFTEIYQAKQKQDSKIELSDDELAAYNNIAEQFSQIQEDTRHNAEEIIKDSGFTMERYKEIGTMAQKDETLKNRIQEELNH